MSFGTFGVLDPVPPLDPHTGLRIVDAPLLGPQLFVGPDAPGEKRLNVHKPKLCWAKPDGGLWTSSLLGEAGSNWVQWCYREHFHLPNEDAWNSWVLHPAPGNPVVALHSQADVRRLLQDFRCYNSGRFGREHSTDMLDFYTLAQHFAGVHLTAEGRNQTQPFGFTSSPTGGDLQWDVESTVWFRWAFTAVENLGARQWLR